MSELDILGISEIRWPGNSDYIKNDLIRLIHSGCDKRGSKGVAVILRGKWKNNVFNTFHLQAQPIDIYIIQVYFPTKNCNNEEIDIMYEQLEEFLRIIDNKSNIFIMGAEIK